MERSDAGWRRCSACKKPIEFEATYWVCNVSTCNRKRTGLAFCSVSCWEVHLPVARHRESWAVERTAPTRQQWERDQKATEEAPRRDRASAPRRRIVPASSSPASGAAEPPASPEDHDILIVASRLKSYIRSCSGMNTSDRVLEPLSEIVRRVCDRAIRNAAADGRKTVLDRDVPRS